MVVDMGKKSAIDWTNDTWNPWQGCHKISPGCRNCYMYRDKKRYGNDPAKVVRSAPATFRLPYKLKGPLVFVCSWSDFFIEEADEWRDEAIQIIKDNSNLTFQILTKRPERINIELPENVWLGVTVENQEMADRRIPELLVIPAVRHFISVEPMLNPVFLRDEWMTIMNLHSINWVIAGCESGPGARTMQTEWARSLKDQCVDAGVPFFLKQMMVAGKLVKMPELDGQVWDQMPEIKR